MAKFLNMNNQSKKLDLLGVVSEDVIASVTHSFIEKKIREKCQGNFDVDCLKKLEERVRVTIIGWLETVFDKHNKQLMKNSEEVLVHFMYETYAQIRTDQMFHIIVEFPESKSALDVFKECLQKCNGYRMKVIKSLKDSFEVRLLRLGATTNDILTAYIQPINSSRILDSSNTIRCIITALTDESSELIPELMKEHHRQLTMQVAIVMTSIWLIIDKKWEPDLVDVPTTPSASKAIRSSDIARILVNVYESKDLFVEEYQRLLVQKFLSNIDCNVDIERRNLELLTLRFGESDLHTCPVTLQDITSSKRLDHRFNSGEIEMHHFKQCRIKCIFWQNSFRNYQRQPNFILDTVELELEFNDRKHSFTVSTIRASIILQFERRQNPLFLSKDIHKS
ncbi:Anaphase-promoting complex subunit 2-like protein [Leptotrombidium deliense]|uniref:Anaphase-promoting complex subunit 2-like protein n=1 Tax=Leptotrombidium deliense TaxID=299467 RepID=A0A443S2L6_9ACAR|nr:Anaphase-promoting complex subunit 2-like protein [Leptotrombidium deliense]